MASIKRKYIDSHWLVFIFQGAVALIFGCLALFTSSEKSQNLIPMIGVALLALAVVEFANSLQRSRNKHGWLVATLVALFDAGFGVTLVTLTNASMATHLCLLAAYTILRGAFELLLGFRTTVDPTDRFIWILCGLCGIVFGFAILNSGHLANVDFVRFFGAYMLIFGVSSLIYGNHNHVQQREVYGSGKAVESGKKTNVNVTKKSAKNSTKASRKTSKKA